jgi:hypothetical protein
VSQRWGGYFVLVMFLFFAPEALGFRYGFGWVRENTQPDALLATAYDSMYYLQWAAGDFDPPFIVRDLFLSVRSRNPDVGWSDEIKPQLDKLGVKYLIIDPLDDYAEGEASLKGDASHQRSRLCCKKQ